MLCGVRDLLLVIVGAVEGHPVVHINRFVVVVVRVVIVLPHVLLGVDLVLVQVVVHVNVRESILELGVVVVGNRREGVEQVGVHLAGLGHGIPLVLFRLSVALLHVGLHDGQVEAHDAGVDQEVEAVAHAAKSAQRIGSETHV